MKVEVGNSFGRLKVVSFSHKDKYYKKYWNCLCKCGNRTTVIERCLLTGETKSCGCLMNESRRNNRRTHGLSGTKLYFVWRSMLIRCEYEKGKSYKDYGGRGIKVCREWHEPTVFFQWANANGYKEGLEIDRINTNGDYCPENCRFISRNENARNKRNTHSITVNGETKTLSEWARELGCGPNVIAMRLSIGWSPAKAVTTKTNRR
jgi:hypothetical protein